MAKKFLYQNLNLKSIKDEKWKDISGLEMYAQVSNYGRIKRLAYELEYSDGRIFLKPDKIIKTVVMKIPNRFTNDHVFFLRATITLFKQKHNFSLARLVYHFSKVMRKSRSSARGFFWKEGHGPLNIDLSQHKYGEVLRAKRRQRPVMQYSQNGKPLRKFDGIKDAAQAVGVNSTSIIGALRGKQDTSAGYKWEYL